MGSDIKVLVVVPVINLWERYTKPMLASIKAQKYACDILLIDNGSSDGTKDFMGDNRVTVVHNAANKGCGGGWNQGMEYAREHGYTHVLLANNDTILSPFTVDQLVYRIEQSDNPVLVSAVDVAGEVSVADDITHEDHAVNHKDASEAPHPNFSCFMVKASFPDEIGWVDEGFFPAYFEDNDLHYRIKLAGRMAIATTTAVFFHFGSRTQNEALEKPVVPGSLFEQNRQYFVNKWGGNPGHEAWTHPFNDEAKDWKYAERK